MYEHYYGEIPEGLTVDHVNRDTLDNRKSNLRLATRLQQNLNQAAHKNGRSPYKGVCWHKRDKVWTSSYCYQGKIINLGYFTDEVSAALAYDRAVYEAYKSTEDLAFCYFNFK